MKCLSFNYEFFFRVHPIEKIAEIRYVKLKLDTFLSEQTFACSLSLSVSDNNEDWMNGYEMKVIKEVINYTCT